MDVLVLVLLVVAIGAAVALVILADKAEQRRLKDQARLQAAMADKVASEEAKADLQKQLEVEREERETSQKRHDDALAALAADRQAVDADRAKIAAAQDDLDAQKKEFRATMTATAQQKVTDQQKVASQQPEVDQPEPEPDEETEQSDESQSAAEEQQEEQQKEEG